MEGAASFPKRASVASSVRHALSPMGDDDAVHMATRQAMEHCIGNNDSFRDITSAEGFISKHAPDLKTLCETLAFFAPGVVDMSNVAVVDFGKLHDTLRADSVSTSCVDFGDAMPAAAAAAAPGPEAAAEAPSRQMALGGNMLREADGSCKQHDGSDWVEIKFESWTDKAGNTHEVCKNSTGKSEGGEYFAKSEDGTIYPAKVQDGVLWPADGANWTPLVFK